MMNRMTNGFQKGDVAVKIEGSTYRLRLTMGALAEIEAKLGAKGPLELAQRIRGLATEDRNNTDALILLQCLMCTPCHQSEIRVPAKVRRAKPMDYMPAIATLFEAAFV